MNRAIWLLVLISLLTGCFGLGSKDDDDNTPHYYVIDIDRGAVASEFAKNRVLKIKPVRVTPHFRGKTVVFRVGDDEYRQQVPHEFFSDPEEMFTEQLKRWLQKSGLFSQVIVDDSAPADMILETAVTALYGDQREQFSPQAVLEMQFFLLAAEQDNAQVLFQTALRIDVDIAETTPPNVVKGWKQGLEQLFATVEDDFRGYFSKRTP
ncbi:MAG: ABC-type transport auxiliary lipoprotein family protein [Methylophagaceae bacterium]